MSRLPPQPTDTALARLVQRIVDAMPWVMARHLREERRAVAKLGATVKGLLEENYHLRKDFETLFYAARGPASPVIEDASVDIRRSEMRMELLTTITVSYRTARVGVAFPALYERMLPISEIGAEAIRCAAHDIAYASLEQHRDNLIKVALRGKSIEELVKA